MKNQAEKKFAVITGASDGIGYELAMQFARHGYDLLVAAEDPGIAEAAQAFQACGVQVDRLQVDLARHEGVESLYAKIQSMGRPVDAVCINAGVGVNGDFARETRLEDELNLIALNVTSVVHLAKRVLKDMVARGEGGILFTSSVVSTMPAPYMACYGASKAFVQSFAQALRNELQDTGITITSLMPGATETNFFHRAGMEDTKVGAAKKDDPADVAREGFEALMKGKDHVVAGSIKNVAQTTAAKVIPEPVKARLHANLTKPGSAGK